MSTMIYHSNASKEVKPDIVGLGISLTEKAQTAKEAITNLNNNRNLVKTFIIGKRSYQPDSYHQANVNIRKVTYKEYYYVDAKKHQISESEYNNLNQTLRNNYTRKVKENFLYYEASLNLVAVLDFGDTVITDLMDVFNMCTEKEFKCNYEHTISDKLRDTTMQELYTICINQGVEAVQNIVNGLNFTTSKEVNLIEVRDPAATSVPRASDNMIRKAAMCMDEACYGASAYEPEQIIMPELLEELFNNNIELTKSLDLTLDF